ncbi:hypothetical protein ABZ864_38565 [Streptomyces sp. NPDC047082]|uniref:hypothetical protein n=1 Tax=Streptomyces sp. NPDC047082 TaxID=3155259 RepID=UPI0033EEAEDF
MDTLLDTQTGSGPANRSSSGELIVNNSPANSSMSNNSNSANSSDNNNSNINNNINNSAMAGDSDAPRLQSVTATDINALAEDLSIVANENNSNASNGNNGNNNDSNSNNNINN